MSTTLYVRLPQRPHDQPQPWQLGAMPFALVRTPVVDKSRRVGEASAPDLLREGHASVSELPAADRLVLIVAASDVLLTHAMVPPLPPARLKLALPNLVEDALATDAQPCHIAIGPGLEPGAPPRGARRRLLMVADRAWLRAVLDAFADHKHRRRHVVPAQLCIPLTPLASREVLRRYEPKLATATEGVDAEVDPLADPEDESADPSAEPGTDGGAASGAATPAEAPVQLATLVVEAATAALAESAALLENAPATRIGNDRLWQVTVRTGAYEGYGLLLGDDALAAWQALAPAGRWHGDRTALAHAPVPALYERRHTGRAPRPLDDWRVWLEGAEDCLRQRDLDLAQFEFAQGRIDRWNLRAWRLPLALACGVLLVQIVGMNAHWLMLRKERDRLEAAQTQALRTAFPQIPVVIDPPLQMRRQVEQLRLASGRSTPDDFLPLADRFANAARSLAPDALQSLEYRGRTLYVTLKPGTDTNALRNSVRQSGLQMDEDKNPPDAMTRATGTPAPAGSRWMVKPGS
ncbi:type II secretion system protein GspL [Cupriavidus plantarum]|uniref:Type II secretion system protein L (GspL) n=1 Tax=Cupriavidus plantarum TaxID=942865 RepID=A0A316ELS4_9BURK|nr:type II secretion system protein GspL [Cupriavidus plantarum]PWK31885.1 type II secretion system protein L (GspL) [Cupriavidus plantarum]